MSRPSSSLFCLLLLVFPTAAGCTNVLDLKGEVMVAGPDASLGEPAASPECFGGQCLAAPMSCLDDTQCEPGLRCVAQVCTAESGGGATDTTAGSSVPDAVVDPTMPPEGMQDAGGVQGPQGETPKTCADITCGENARCVTEAQGAVCKCDGGFVDQDGSGVCVSKCELAACAAVATCTITAEGEAECACPPDYIGDGETCEFDADCQLLACGANTECVAEGGGRVCQCLQGYEQAPGGGCQDIDECARRTAGCGIHQDCANTPGGAECTCREDPACENGTAIACDGDREYHCEADADGCLTPLPSTACVPENECQTASCSVNSGCASTPKLVGTGCSDGVCNLTGSCVDCIVDEHCDGDQYCTLLGNCRATVCGDGVVSGDETCDKLLASEWECSASCEEQTLYTNCSSPSDCIDGYCVQPTGSASSMCAPAAGTEPPSQGCPRLSGRTIKYWNARYCVIECGTDSDCPSVAPRCVENDAATATPPPSDYEATKFCAP